MNSVTINNVAFKPLDAINGIGETNFIEVSSGASAGTMRILTTDPRIAKGVEWDGLDTPLTITLASDPPAGIPQADSQITLRVMPKLINPISIPNNINGDVVYEIVCHDSRAEFVDLGPHGDGLKRAANKNPVVAKGFNVVQHNSVALQVYYAWSLFNGGPWAWSEIVNFINQNHLPAARQLETAPQPVGETIWPKVYIPQQIMFSGITVDKVIDAIAAHMFCIVGYNFTTNKLMLWLPGDTSVANTALITKWGPRQLNNNNSAYMEKNLKQMPSAYLCCFPCVNYPSAFPVYTYQAPTQAQIRAGQKLLGDGPVMPLHLGHYFIGENNFSLTAQAIAKEIAFRANNLASINVGVSIYPGIVPFELDGNIRNIRWDFGRNGCTTTIRTGNDRICSPFEIVTRNMDMIANSTVNGLRTQVMGNPTGKTIIPIETAVIRKQVPPLKVTGFGAGGRQDWLNGLWLNSGAKMNSCCVWEHHGYDSWHNTVKTVDGTLRNTYNFYREAWIWYCTDISVLWGPTVAKAIAAIELNLGEPGHKDCWVMTESPPYNTSDTTNELLAYGPQNTVLNAGCTMNDGTVEFIQMIFYYEGDCPSEFGIAVSLGSDDVCDYEDYDDGADNV